jgi:predicted enzyme related to lactoylglutathione lyase
VPSLFEPLAEPIATGGICHVALWARDLEATPAFYAELLGFEHAEDVQLPHCGEHVVLRAASGQLVALCRTEAELPPDQGRHVGYGFASTRRDDIVRRAAERGLTVYRYHEDRPAEAGDNYYLIDPSGNRLQLVADGAAIDHACIQAVDIEWEEDLYVRSLGFAVDHVVGWRTEDYKAAKRWGEGREEMAPGTRRKDLRFGTVPGQVPLIPRPNMQLFVKTGAQALGVFLMYEHYQLPPEERVVGTPRVGLRVSGSMFEPLRERFAQAKLPIVGPVEHPASSPYASSLFVRDYGANFIEFCCLREGNV